MAATALDSQSQSTQAEAAATGASRKWYGVHSPSRPVSFVLSASLICLRLPLLNPPLKISQKTLELGCVLRQSFMLRNMPIVSASFSLPRLNLMLGSRIMRSLRIGAMGLLLKLLRKKLVGPLLFGGKRKMCGSDMSSQAASARGMPVSTRRSLLLFSSLLTATIYVALVPPEGQSVPTSWLKETVDVVIDLSGAGRPNPSEATPSVHTVCPASASSRSSQR